MLILEYTRKEVIVLKINFGWNKNAKNRQVLIKMEFRCQKQILCFTPVDKFDQPCLRRTYCQVFKVNGYMYAYTLLHEQWFQLVYLQKETS